MYLELVQSRNLPRTGIFQFLKSSSRGGTIIATFHDSNKEIPRNLYQSKLSSSRWLAGSQEDGGTDAGLRCVARFEFELQITQKHAESGN